ncbi:MAG: 3-dehydroquinate synthase, partial [Planctomycetota bacterium]
MRPVTLWGGEPAKNLDTIEQLYTQCAKARLGRDGGIVALGGGCVSDIAGFAAATWNRGIRWAVIPTTLLAQVDAAIGGKTAVNRPEGKNLVGAFHQPEVVLSDPTALRSLPRRELCSGLAEVVKSAVIGDAELFAL